jgi:hypothetical protein
MRRCVTRRNSAGLWSDAAVGIGITDLPLLRRFAARGVYVSAGQSAADGPDWTRWSTCSESLALFWPYKAARDAAVLRASPGRRNRLLAIDHPGRRCWQDRLRAMRGDSTLHVDIERSIRSASRRRSRPTCPSWTRSLKARRWDPAGVRPNQPCRPRGYSVHDPARRNIDRLPGYAATLV